MKVGGIEVGHAEPNDIVFPRGFNEKNEPIFIRIVAQQVLSMDEFDAVCPKPTPGGWMTKNGWEQTDVDAPAYKQNLKEWRERRWAYIRIKSLEPSAIEWELVKLDDPETWNNFEKDLRSFLGYFEFNQVIALIDQANALDEAALDKARADFFLTLARPVATQASIGQATVPVST